MLTPDQIVEYLQRVPRPPVDEWPPEVREVVFAPSDAVQTAKNRAQLACNRMWDRHYEKLAGIEHDFIGAEGILAECMLTVAIGKTVAWKGFREMAAMLGSIAANFEKLADGVDAAIVEAGGSVDIKCDR